VFDPAKLAWMNRHYMKEAAPSRIARLAAPYFETAGFLTAPSETALGYLETLLPMAVGSVDRVEEIPDRLTCVFRWDVTQATLLVEDEDGGPAVIRAFAEEVESAGPLDRETFRAAAGRVRQRTGKKGAALFHPIRVALTGEPSGPELDLAIPAIDRGAGLSGTAGVAPILSCRLRAREVVARLSK
jgi:glutamyl/glutaminyl-tRNA synthetase